LRTQLRLFQMLSALKARRFANPPEVLEAD
jgi:hypothetical protein